MRIDSYETSATERLLLLGRRRHTAAHPAQRLLITEAGAAALFLAAAITLAALAPSAHRFSAPALVVTVVAYLVAARVQYPVGSAWTAPTQLVFVPMLFFLPTPFVPLIVATCSVADRLPQLLRRTATPTRVLARVGDSFYALGPALVLVLVHAQSFSWQRWPILLLAFFAQVVFDAGGGLGRTWFAERIPPSGQVTMLWLYFIDACLACVAVFIAAAAIHRPGLVLLALPLIGLQWLLAQERRQRLHYSFALKEEHRIAVDLQRGLLPKRLPQPPGIELAAHYQAAGDGAEAGGDWYDAFVLPGGGVGVVVGDVTGKGLAAASTMGQLRSVTRALALTEDVGGTPGEVLTRLNHYQLALAERLFFTVTYAIVDPDHGTISWATAGHPPPLLRTASGSTRYLDGGGPMIGIGDGAYATLEAAVGPGDSVIFYTDGLVERRGESLDVGLQRLAGAAGRGPAASAALCGHILSSVLPPGDARSDDVATVVLRLSENSKPLAGAEAGLRCAAVAE